MHVDFSRAYRIYQIAYNQKISVKCSELLSIGQEFTQQCANLIAKLESRQEFCLARDVARLANLPVDEITLHEVGAQRLNPAV